MTLKQTIFLFFSMIAHSGVFVSTFAEETPTSTPTSTPTDADVIEEKLSEEEKREEKKREEEKREEERIKEKRAVRDKLMMEEEGIDRNELQEIRELEHEWYLERIAVKEADALVDAEEVLEEQKKKDKDYDKEKTEFLNKFMQKKK